VLVMVSARKGDALRDRLGAHNSQVEYADIARVGANPAGIIPLSRCGAPSPIAMPAQPACGVWANRCGPRGASPRWPSAGSTRRC
jgi:hypothetical protein